NKRNLLICKWANFLAIDGDRAEKLAFLEHRYGEKRARPGQFDHGHARWLALDIGPLLRDISNVDRLIGLDQATESVSRVPWKGSLPDMGRKSRFHIPHGLGPERIAIVSRQSAEARFAKPSRVGEYGLEHGLQFAR